MIECFDMDVKRYLEKFNEIVNEMASKMLCPTVTCNITTDFIQCMIPHHQGAIDMCKNLLQYTNYVPLQEKAKSIIQMQTKEIEDMKEILISTQVCLNSNKNVECYMNTYLEITRKMIDCMKSGAICNNVNLNFINEMIPHHEGAVAMCHNLLIYCVDPRLEKMAKNIIGEQTSGVEQLEEMRKDLIEMEQCNNSLLK